MKDKGFTLVEIIAVVVIMGILLLIVVPTTSNLMRSNEEKEYVTYYEMVEAGLEKYARTRREEVGGTQDVGCIDDKNLSDMIRLGYIKEFDQEDDIFCGTPREFDQALLSGWGIDTSKTYASMRVEGDHGKITTKLSLICVKMNEDGTYNEEPEYIKLVEGGECTPSAGSEPPPIVPPPPSITEYHNVTYDKNNGVSCTKTNDIIESGQAVDLTPTCTRTSYTFKGWSKTRGGSKLTTLTMEDEDITLYAIWEYNSIQEPEPEPDPTPEASYTITYDPNGGDGSMIVESITYGNNWSTRGKIYRKTEYVMSGWRSSSGIFYNLSTNQGAYSMNDNLLLKAEWRPAKCEVYLGTLADPDNATLQVNMMSNCGFSNPITYTYNGQKGAKTSTYDKTLTETRNIINSCFVANTNSATIDYPQPGVPFLHYIQVYCEDGTNKKFSRGYFERTFIEADI